MEHSKESTLPISLPQKHELRSDIQGLRAVAIGAVLVFHMWSTWFPLGFLGVDVFFVISGYLMFSILSRRRLNFATSLDFYFRRFRRIVPLYLFLIVSVLIAAILLVHPFDYAQLLNETFPSILYFSNCPAVHGTSYFDLRSNNLFFKHTWSLATELQFYAIVPLIFLIFQFLTGIHIFFTWIFILYIACLSFYRQTFVYTRPDSIHMAPDGRLWQFFAGFIAFIIRDSEVMARFKPMKKSDSNLNFHIKQLLTQILPSVLLVFFLFSTIGVDWPQAMKRVLTVLLTVWLLALSSTQSSSFLTWLPLQKLGDFSYSLYLVHWPIYIMHRYLNPQDYDLDFVAGRDISWTIGCPLIAFSLVVGFVTEELTKRVLIKIKSWTALIAICFGLYFSLAVLIIYIGQRKMFAFDTSPMTKEWSDQVFEEVVLLHQQPDLQISHLESMNLNREITKFGINPMLGNATPVPTSFPVTYASNVYVQKLVGNGTKNIVIIGNSHAVCAIHGVQHYFKDVYANLTLYSALACMLMPMDKQIPDAKPFCLSYMNEVIAALRQWEHKIDIVMIFFGFARVPDYSLEGQDVEQDSTFQFIQSFHSNLSEIARDIVFASNVSMHFKIDQIRIVQQRLHDRKVVGKIGTTRKVAIVFFCCSYPLQEQLTYLPSMRKRFQHLQCSNCIWIQFLDLWCNGREANSFCYSVDPNNHLVYFADYHHVSVYGSLFQAQYLRQLYNQSLVK
ncbi:hypothetical protein M3Y94_01262800 [Aphelenchoides besseyi]|nr:hypothetical protein M3Y94_01262800 [Aphelenchoides besseyi]